MPAVVIVNATRTTNSTQNQFETPEGMPDEFNDLFKKFFHEKGSDSFLK